MKKILVLLLALIICFSLAACGTSDEEPTVEKTVAAVSDALGFEGDGEYKAYQIIEADDGAGFGDYEIYIYNDESSQVYKDLTGDGYETGFGSMKAAAGKSGVILLYNGDGEPDQAIIDKFNSLNIK